MVRDHGLDLEVSAAGHAALALIEALGGVEEIRRLAHPGVVALLYRLAERSGMTWWKRRWSQAHKEIATLGIGGEAFEELGHALGRDEPAVAPAGEGRELAFPGICEAAQRAPRRRDQLDSVG